jgi:hypothetical protein
MASTKEWWITENGHLHVLATKHSAKDYGKIATISTKEQKTIFVVSFIVFNLPFKFTTEYDLQKKIEVTYQNLKLQSNYETKPYKAATFLSRLKAFVEVLSANTDFVFGINLL